MRDPRRVRARLAPPASMVAALRSAVRGTPAAFNSFIFRSVGPGRITPLASDSSVNRLTITGNTATFINLRPADRGVGDAAQYVCAGNAPIDRAASVSLRLDAHHLSRQSAAGGRPGP